MENVEIERKMEDVSCLTFFQFHVNSDINMADNNCLIICLIVKLLNCFIVSFFN